MGVGTTVKGQQEGLFGAMEPFCVLTVVLVTQIHTWDKNA